MKYNLKINIPSFERIVEVLINDKFFSTIVISLYTTTNIVTLLGSLANVEVG
jgi:hypothetical protein